MTDGRIIRLDVDQVVLGDRDVIKSCVLLLTQNGIIVASFEGMNNWVIVFIIAFFVVGFIGLLLKNLVLLLVGLTTGTLTGIVIGLFDFVLHHRRLNNIKRLSSKRILEMSEENFEVSYERIATVEVGALSTYPKANYLFPTIHESQYKVDFITKEGRYTFVMDRGKLEQCLEILHQYAPTIEIEGTTIDE